MRFFRSRAGFTTSEVLVVTAIVTSVSTAAYVNVKDRAKQTVCVQQLKQIGQALMMFELTNGKLPDAAFFSKDPMKDKDSIRVIMKDQVDGKLFVCPSAPEQIAGKGVTFLWNDTCSGKASHRIKNARTTWLMIEVNAVSDSVPAPHPNGYNILYADLQTVKTVKELPKDLREARRTSGVDSKEADPGEAKPDGKKSEEKKPDGAEEKPEEKKPEEKPGAGEKEPDGKKPDDTGAPTDDESEEPAAGETPKQ